MIETTFKSGNYNKWESFILETLPAKISLIRDGLIPKIDDVLVQMLKKEERIHKESINIEQSCSRNQIVNIKCTIQYDIEDFHVPDAPLKAVENDTKNLTDALNFTDASLESLTIDVTKGSLTIIYNIPLGV